MFNRFIDRAQAGLAMSLPALALAAATTLISFSAVAEPIPFELKGYRLGADMESCPPNFETENAGATTYCQGRGETLAGKPVIAFLITIYQQKIIGVGVSGMESPTEVVEALKYKFGKPTKSRRHIHEYTWVNGKTQMRIKAFSGVTSTLVLQDMTMSKAAQAEYAKGPQPDDI